MIILTYTPAGECPAKLKATDRNSVMEWVDRIAESGEKTGHKYMPEAIKYWVRHVYDMNSKEYKEVCAILAEELGTTPVSNLLPLEKTSKPSRAENAIKIEDLDFDVQEETDEDNGDIKVK